MATRSESRIVTFARITLCIPWLVLVACSAGSTPSSSPSGSTTASPASSVHEIDVGGYALDLECSGKGSPTVVFEAGAGGDRSAFADQWLDLRDATRVCAYDRAGIGTSDPRPSTGSTSVGDLADELLRVLDGAGIEEPIVLVSHSLGGGVAQFYAGRHPNRVAGLVFVDTIAIPGYVDWFGPTVEDGGSTIDMKLTAKDWESIGSFGAIPTIVLTQNFQGEDDNVPTAFRRYLRQAHAELAQRSSDSLHVIAVDSGHMIHETAPDLVSAAVSEVIDAVRSGEPLARCDDRFEDLGGACATPQA